ncbi:MAG: exo-beta-N-acetylmuramidase NamZ domain-containing protein [Pirellula sp.]
MTKFFVSKMLASWTLLAVCLQAFGQDSLRVPSDRIGAFDAQVQRLVEQSIAEKKMPGCIVAVGNRDGVFYQKAFGNRSLDPVAPMTLDTVFDMASITKPVATATSIMQLIERGEMRLKDKVSSYFPEFATNEKEPITVEHLLLHTSGLIPDNPLADYLSGPDTAWEKILGLSLSAPIATAFKYSDVNFIVLGKIVEKISGKSLDAYTRENIFEPLGMKETGYLPNESLRSRCAPTEKRDGNWIQGQVHDPRAYNLGGVAGHAGLFSTTHDLSLYAISMLRTIRGPATRDILSPATLDKMTRGYLVPNGLRGLGWDKRSGFSVNRGDLFSEKAFGHGGFTGTVLWIDPGTDLFFIFLSNRVHPDGKGLVNPLAGKIANQAVQCFGDLHAKDKTVASLGRNSVRNGIDVLESQAFGLLQGQRVGLITNHTGRNLEGLNTVTVLSKAPGVKLVALFSPEHGFEGKLDISKVDNSQDKNTGLMIYSLYGENRKPTPELLSSIDTVVFDIQDVGARFYTYVSTMGEAMKAAAEHGKKFVVLDRPNPIGGQIVSGPMLDKGQEAFVAFHSLPVRHGMTIGELAKMFRDELKLELDLTVVPCEGWTREMNWDATGLTWINPSPNMRSLTQAFLYPGIGLIEMTNVSVGRGTDTPFQVVGAPWISGPLLAQELNREQLPGVVFIPIEFTPQSSKHANVACQGIELIITDRERFESVATGLAIARALRKLYPQAWETKNLNTLLRSQTIRDAILDGSIEPRFDERLHEGIFEFQQRRQKYLIYP